MTNNRYFFHTINNRRVRIVDLKKVNLDGPAIVKSPLLRLQALRNDVIGTYRARHERNEPGSRRKLCLRCGAAVVAGNSESLARYC